jgi:hypothetical protein
MSETQAKATIQSAQIHAGATLGAAKETAAATKEAAKMRTEAEKISSATLDKDFITGRAAQYEKQGLDKDAATDMARQDLLDAKRPPANTTGTATQIMTAREKAISENGKVRDAKREWMAAPDSKRGMYEEKYENAKREAEAKWDADFKAQQEAAKKKKSEPAASNAKGSKNTKTDELPPLSNFQR